MSRVRIKFLEHYLSSEEPWEDTRDVEDHAKELEANPIEIEGEVVAETDYYLMLALGVHTEVPISSNQHPMPQATSPAYVLKGSILERTEVISIPVRSRSGKRRAIL